MKILVCVSCVPDTTSKVSFTEDNKFNKENIQFIIGPYEDYALARAVELKEKNSEIDISLLNVGLSENCLLYTSPSPRDLSTSRMPSSA